jgi:peptidoglycan biosynthesis protein MviN/MurJ (putative lipid II flippase)
MTVLPIASNLPFGMYLPVVVLLAGFALVSLLATVARNREEQTRAERLGDIAFLLVVLGAVYALVLLIAAAVSYPQRFTDMLLITFVVVAFFAVLLGVFFFFGELLPRRLSRRGPR